MTTKRSRGSVALLRTGKDQDEIARLLDVTQPAVAQWLSGQTKPGVTKRKKMRELLGILDEWWDEEHQTPAPAPDDPTKLAEIPQGVLPMASVLEERARRLLLRLNDPEAKLALTEESKIMRSVVGTLQHLARLRGDYDLGKQFFRLPQYQRLRRAIVDGLKNFPEAAAALEVELRRVEIEVLGGEKAP